MVSNASQFLGQTLNIWDQKDFNKEIKNTRHDLMPQDHPQEFIDSVLKLSRSSCPPSDTVYQSMVFIPMSMSGPFSKLNISA
jgi:hypothetical protein